MIVTHGHGANLGEHDTVVVLSGETSYVVPRGVGYVLADVSTGDLILTVPIDRVLTIKKTDDSGNAIIVTPSTGTIEGFASQSISQRGSSAMIVPTHGTNLSIISTYIPSVRRLLKVYNPPAAITNSVNTEQFWDVGYILRPNTMREGRRLIIEMDGVASLSLATMNGITIKAYVGTTVIGQGSFTSSLLNLANVPLRVVNFGFDMVGASTTTARSMGMLEFISLNSIIPITLGVENIAFNSATTTGQIRIGITMTSTLGAISVQPREIRVSLEG